jgi:hypothetical protein
MFDSELFFKKYKTKIVQNGQTISGDSRLQFLFYALSKLVRLKRPIYVVETGTQWIDIDNLNNQGSFTYILGDFISNYVGGKLITIDNDKEHLELSKVYTKEFANNIEYILGDSVEVLDKIKDKYKFDLVYLDSFDLIIPKPKPSAEHHLNELKVIYDYLTDDVIVTVDDNYPPNTTIMWKTFRGDTHIKNEHIYTENKIIGKGSLIHPFLLNSGWVRHDEFLVPHSNSLYCYERHENFEICRLNKEYIREILHNFYFNYKEDSKEKINPYYKCKVILNQPPGLGDFLILTPFCEDYIVYTTFPEIKVFLENFSNVDIDTYFNFDFRKLSLVNHQSLPFDEIKYTSDFAKHNWGGGHVIQRIEKALGLKPSIKPKPKVIVGDVEKIKGRVAVHLISDSLRINSMNGLQESDIGIINSFIEKNKHEYEFVDIEDYTKNKDIVGLTNFLATCEYFLGLHTGIMHLATGLDLKCIIIVNNPDIDNFYLPKLREVYISDLEWLYPQNIHIHTKGYNELVPRLNEISLRNAFEGNVYPYFDNKYLEVL